MSDPTGRIIRLVAQYPGRLLAKTRVTPNQVTFFGFLANFIVAYLIAESGLNYFVIGLLIWVVGFIDALDGSLARATGKTSTFGEFWDSVLDRYSDSVIYFGILLRFLRTGQSDYVIVVVIALIGSFVVSYTRARAESLGRKCEVGILPRAVRIIILGGGFCVNQVFPGLLIIAVLSHLTVAQRIFYVYRGLNERK